MAGRSSPDAGSHLQASIAAHRDRTTAHAEVAWILSYPPFTMAARYGERLGL